MLIFFSLSLFEILARRPTLSSAKIVNSFILSPQIYLSREYIKLLPASATLGECIECSLRSLADCFSVIPPPPELAGKPHSLAVGAVYFLRGTPLDIFDKLVEVRMVAKGKCPVRGVGIPQRPAACNCADHFSLVYFLELAAEAPAGRRWSYNGKELMPHHFFSLICP